jgi:hypothetical protein
VEQQLLDMQNLKKEELEMLLLKPIQIVKNNENIENINVSKYQFENDNIKIYKYEK